MQDDIDAQVGARLRELRDEIKWTQPQVAELVSRHLGKRVDPTTVTKTEKGRRPITASELLAYARIYGVSVEQLLVPQGDVRFVYEILNAAERLREAESNLIDAKMEYEDRQSRLGHQLADLDERLSDKDVLEPFGTQLKAASALANRSVDDVFGDELERQRQLYLDSLDTEESHEE